MQTVRYMVPWPEGATQEEVAENPPSMPKVEKLLNDSSKEILAVEEARVLFFTKEWYSVTIQYKGKVEQEVK
ncbi:hypothetical protein ACLHWY_17605 [Priestia aryabhattai]|uniref:hypothetical protein n=1 Tax=Priestia aryabhattai TaxID=412384 RepID=UPI003982F6BC